MDELNGRLLACQVLLTGLIARVANTTPDPLQFLTDYRDEVRAVVNGLRIDGLEDARNVRQIASATIDELFGLLKAPSSSEPTE